MVAEGHVDEVAHLLPLALLAQRIQFRLQIAPAVRVEYGAVGGRRPVEREQSARATATALVSVTVVHPSAALADAAATALLVAGPARWPAIAARLGVAQVLVVDAQGRAQASPALAPRLHWV